MVSESWRWVFSVCAESDVILDDKIARHLLWHGGLSQIAGSGALSCQQISAPTRQFGHKGLVLIAQPIIGEVVHKIEALVKKHAWFDVKVKTNRYDSPQVASI